MSKALAWYMYPEPNGRYYYEDELKNPNTVIEIFDYCQILLGTIQKLGWKFLVNYYGYERLFEFNNESGWEDCESLSEYKSVIEYHMNIAP